MGLHFSRCSFLMVECVCRELPKQSGILRGVFFFLLFHVKSGGLKVTAKGNI